MRILFMGTPEFAVPSLRRLFESRHEIVAVVTQPDRPRGRGLKPGAPPVKEVALELGLAVLQPEDLKGEEFVESIRAQSPDIAAVVAFAILPESIYRLPPKGAVNLHASLLPKYRGACPINRALMNGETETGVTTFIITSGFDTGAIILQRRTDIDPDETAGELHDRLAVLGAHLLVETLDLIASGQAQPSPQPRTGGSRAPKLRKADAVVDWNRPARQVHNQVRGLSPRPGAVTTIDGKSIKLLRTRVVDLPSHGWKPGEVAHVEKTGPVVVATASGCVGLLEVQPAGARCMTAAEFARGYRLREGQRFRSSLA